MQSDTYELYQAYGSAFEGSDLCLAPVKWRLRKSTWPARQRKNDMPYNGIPVGTHHLVDMLIPAVSAHIVLAFALAFAPRQAKHLRFSATALVAALCLETIRRKRPDSIEESDFGDYMFGLAVHASCHLLLKNLSPGSALRSKTQKLQWAIHALFSPRMDVQLSKRDPPNMTKAAFILRRSAVAALGLIAWAYVRAWVLLPAEFGPWDVARSKDSMISQVLAGTYGLRELRIRAAFVVASHAGSALVINSAHCICAVFAVCVLDSPISEWPPLFGNIFEAYSVRRYYSHFWHKLMRKGFTLHSVILTEKVFALRKETWIGRAMVVILSFCISGMMHTITAWTPGPCQNLRPLWSFVEIGLVILFEQGVQQVYQRLHRSLGVHWTKVELVWWRVFGCCWVIFYWLSSAGPLYKDMRCSYGFQ